MGRVAIFGAVILSLVCFNTPAISADGPLQIVQETAKWRDMTEAELRKNYINNTLTFTLRSSGHTVKQYFKADGTYDTVCCAYDWNYRNHGVWSVKGNELCQTAKSGRREGTTNCVKLITDGKTTKRKDGKSGSKNRTWEVGNKLP